MSSARFPTPPTPRKAPSMIQHLEESRTWRRGIGVAVALLVTAAMWGVSGQGAGAATVAIAAKDFVFTPAEVTIKVGDTVTWTNGDAESHAAEGGSLSSPEIRPGESYSKTFTAPEDVSYVCRFHTYMTGTIHVLPAGASVPPPAPTTTAPRPTAPSSTVAPPPGDEAPPTTVAPRPTGTRGSDFQDVPDDPSARRPPGSDAPTSTAPASTGTSVPAPQSTTPPKSHEFQEVPDDPSGVHEPGDVQAQSVSSEDPSPPGAPPDAGKPLGDGTVLAPYSTVDGVKEFHLTMDETTVEVSPGVVKPAYAFNGVVPGPTLRVDEGDRIRIVVDNQLPFPTSTHWHGMILPNDQDGVGGITQPHIQPGERYVYEYTAVATGTHWYHAHSSGRHIGKGLYGMLEVVPEKGDIEADHDYSLMLGDTDLGFTINGRSFPSTPVLQTAVGETVRLRVVNTGDQVHAFHLHGVPFKVMAQDGMPRSEPESMDTLTISPGQTFDLLFSERYPGKWVVHCHMFVHSHDTSDTHHDGESGMVGMTAVVQVTPAPAGSGQPSGSLVPGVPDPQLGAASVLGLAAVAVVAVRRRRVFSNNPPIQEP